MGNCALKRALTFGVALMIAFSMFVSPLAILDGASPYPRPTELGASQPAIESCGAFGDRIIKWFERDVSGELPPESGSPTAPRVFQVRACNLEWSLSPFQQHVYIPHSIHAPPTTSK